MVLDLCQPADNPDENRVIGNAEHVTKRRATRRMLRKDAEIQPERNHFDLRAAPDAKFLANLDTLLFADHHQTIGNHPREQSFNREKHACAIAAVVAVKNVPVIRVHKLALAWPADKRARRQPAIKETG